MNQHCYSGDGMAVERRNRRTHAPSEDAVSGHSRILNMRKHAVLVACVMMSVCKSSSAFTTSVSSSALRLRAHSTHGVGSHYRGPLLGGPFSARKAGGISLRMQENPTITKGDSYIKNKLAVDHKMDTDFPPKLFSWIPRPPPEFQNELALVAAAGIVGAVTGSTVAAFKIAIKELRDFTYSGPWADFVHNLATMFEIEFQKITGVLPDAAYNPEYVLFPILGGFVVSAIMYLEKNELGPGVQGIVAEIDQGKGIDLRKYFAKVSAAIATLGSGLSLGPEGPAVEIGAGISRMVSQSASFPRDAAHLLVSSGCSAGVAAGFDAPLAAIVFALEIVQPTVSDKEKSVAVARAAAPSVFIAAVVSALFKNLILGAGETFEVKQDLITILNSSPIVELPVFFGLGVVCGVLATGFKGSIEFFKKFYRGDIDNFKFMGAVPQELRPILGAILCGITASVFPQVLFFGYETLKVILEDVGAPTVAGLASLCAAKLLLTASSLGSGLVGGIFAPSLFIGATAGSAYAQVVQTLGISIAGGPTYAMVGGAAVLAATFRAPVTAVILLFELTQKYDVIAPLIASCAFATLTIDLLASPEGKSSTWAWWWNINSPALTKPEQELLLRNEVLAQVKYTGGDMTKALKALDEMYVAVNGGMQISMYCVNSIMNEMMPQDPDGTGVLCPYEDMRDALDRIYASGNPDGVLTQEEAENVLRACVSVMGSLPPAAERRLPVRQDALTAGSSE